jgi:lipoprotein NlpI
MKLQLSTLVLLPFIFLLSACGTLPANNSSGSSDNRAILVLPVATAVQIDYKDEVTLLRINQLIAEHKGDKKEKALLLYERGLIYDRMGLNAHSRYDFTQSINTYPALPGPYNSLGIYQLLSQSYDEAFDSFDSALELSEEMHFSYLHRAVGLYQVKRYSLASSDINTFYDLDRSDPFRVLWRYVIDSKIDAESALKNLQKAQSNGDNHYAWDIIDVIAGRTPESVFFADVAKGVASNKQMAERLCEAYFYLAHWHQLNGELDKAIYYFKMATTTNIHEFIEYKYALMELASIQQALQKELVEKRGQ